MHYTPARKSGRITGWIIEVYEIPFEVATNGDDLSIEPEKALDEELSPHDDFLHVENLHVENHIQVVSNCSSKETRNNISVDDYKKRIATATAQGIINSGKSHSKGIRQWPPDVQAYGDVWTRCIELGTMQLTKSQYSTCIKEFRELQAREITPELFETGYHGAAYFDGMSVTHPLGCWYAADEVRRGIRSPEGNRKDTKTKPRPKPVSAEA
jgi:hypothetical protein